MKNKTIFCFLILILLVLIIIFFIIHTFLVSKEKNNNSAEAAFLCAKGLYQYSKDNGVKFDSQCLGICGNYSVDIVHVPRTEEDNLTENQCTDYASGKTNHFIELDEDGNIVRLV